MHLSIDARQAAICVQDHGGVVIDTWTAALEDRADDDHAELGSQGAEPVGGWARNRLGPVELCRVLGLTEVGAVVQLRQQDEPAAARVGALEVRLAGLEIAGNGESSTGLDESGSEH